MSVQAKVDLHEHIEIIMKKHIDLDEQPEHKQLKIQEVQTQSLIQVYSIDQNYLLGLKVSNLTNSCTSSAILLQPNGSPIIFPVLILKSLIFQLNELIKPNFFCFYNPKHQLIFNIKQIKFNINKNDYHQYLRSKFMELANIITMPLYLLGIDPRVRYGNFKNGNDNARKIGQYRIQAMKQALKAKYLVVKIVKKFCQQKQANLKQSQDKIAVKQQVQIDISQLQQSVKIYKYYDNEKQRNQISQINRSQKYEISQNLITLQIVQTPNKKGEIIQTLPQIKCELVEKCVKIANPKLEERAYNKLCREINIIKQIKYGSQYFPKYYLHKEIDEELQRQEQQNFYNIKLLVQRFPNDLGFWIANQFLDVKGIAERSSELAKGIKMLHLSGVVHRDLKPENIMISQSQNDTSSRIKIIDFSDSALTSQFYTKKLSNSLGSSLPYSPFECLFNCDFGTNSPTIDIWSLGILVYEMFYGQLPSLYYYNTTREQAVGGISRNEFSLTITPKYRRMKLGYFSIIEEIVQLIVHFCVVLVHTDRLHIEQIIKIVQIWKQFMNINNDIVQEYRNTYEDNR